MAEIEKIRGAAIVKLLTELQQFKTPLKIRRKADGKEYLTYIADIRKRQRTLHFLVNSQEDLPNTGAAAKPSRLGFEFIDQENIKYIFETHAEEFSRGMIWFAFPEFIQRYQRRSLFRLEAPPGARLYFKVNNVRYKLLVINVSLGGTLGVLVSLTKQMEHELTSCESQTLENVELCFPPKNQKEKGSVVRIKRCRIIRQEPNPMTQKLECALEFKEIAEDEQKKLTRLFYSWQREYLRRRKLMRD
jgi:c-di-GMP-binding flagellar brake protein YcgR